jgi:hypothetical protein
LWVMTNKNFKYFSPRNLSLYTSLQVFQLGGRMEGDGRIDICESMLSLLLLLLNGCPRCVDQK